MLQPRISASGKMEGIWIWRFFVLAALCALATCQEINDEEIIESSRIKREGVPENRDLTVLLVNQKNDYNSRVGRYHQVKPLIGLLTSTARTFIQDGVTTEFATQILGTTLDNGRIYAQLLTKSSLVLYNKPSNIDDPVVVQPTRIHSAFDGEWNVKQDLGFIDPEKFVLKNTDYLAPSSKVSAVYASKPSEDGFNAWSPPASQVDNNQIIEEPVGRRVQQYKEIPRYIQNEVDGPVIENEKRLEYVVEPSFINNVNNLHRQSKAYEPVTEPIKVSEEKEAPIEPSVVKVKPDYELPTFTIKNEFSPIFYYIDNVESKRLQPQSPQQTKVPKKLFGQKSEPRPKKTFTYEGFADFTTVVGDTVIVFTPNTEIIRPQNPEEVNVFPSARRVDKLATKITFLSADIPVATSTYKANEVTSPSALPTPGSSVEENRSEKALFSDEESLTKVLYDVDDKVPDSVSVQYNNNGFDFNKDVIQPSEISDTTTESSQITDDLGVLPIQEFSPQATPILNDPLSNYSPTNTMFNIPTESAVTEDMTELFTNSEEENENTAAEVTEKPEEEEEEQEEEATAEAEEEVVTTTESGHSEESYEEMETTTESRPYMQQDAENDFHEDVICTHGLETQSTMTTAYKTLTYLTTYFIPLESTETTTSVKSDVVVESNVGYITNVVCATEYIEPTTVVNVDVNYSMHSNIHKPLPSSEAPITSPPATESSTEPTSKTAEPSTEEPTTVQEPEKSEENQSTSNSNQGEDTEEENEEDKEATVSTTTEAVTTTESHVELSVSTAPTTTTTEKPVTEEEEDSENEIDVIYKTLYTTYTYFTTFFGEATSSVASHKSVVTNILTSTIDLSKLDPSLLGAFNEDEIAPTNVGIGRPTETYVNSIIDLVKNKDVIESVEAIEAYSSQTPTPSLGDDAIASIRPDAVKTYFTTYTFFTTIYVGIDANVCSRSEVYTNYVGPEELIPTKTNPLVENTKAQFDFRNCKQVKRAKPADSETEDTSSMVTSVSMEESSEKAAKLQEVKEEAHTSPQPSPIEVDMLFSVDSNPIESENFYFTELKSRRESSSSKGERQYIDSNNILDDQISSESNIDEIMPSPTLLLQTSYTTFTYFTTMYIGKDSSKVKSHLETITNVVTETIMPNKESEDESNLPITYYTTFTYWTTLYKDKSTTITSREEIVSNIVTPSVQSIPTISPIDTTPIDIEGVLPPKELEIEIKPSLTDDSLETDDGKATFYTTYTYFTTFYAGNTSQIRSSLETVTNIVDNTKVVEDNQIARKVPSGSGDKNLIQDNGEKPLIIPTSVKEEITPTKQPDLSSASPTVLLGTYIDNLFAEVKPVVTSPEPEKKILFSQVAVISGDSTVVTSDNKTLTTESANTTTTTTTEGSKISPTPEVIETSVTEQEPTTERSEDDDGSNKKKTRLTFTPKKSSVTPVIIPFSSRNRPTFVPKRVPSASGAVTISRQDATPTITATPTLKSASRPSSGFSGNRKIINSALPGPGASKRQFGRSSITNPSGNIPSASRAGNLGGRASIQPTSRRTGFRSSSARSNSADYISRSAIPRVRPTASSRLQFGRSSIRPSASITFAPQDPNEYGETIGTQQDETATEALDEVSEVARTTNNPLFRFRRPPVARQPGTPFVPRSTTAAPRRAAVTPRGRATTTTRKVTTRATTNPLLSLRRQRTNALFPRRNLFKQPEPEPEEEVVEEEEEILEGEEFEEDNDYDSSDRKERQVETPSTAAPKKSNVVQIRPFGFRRRTKRQVDYGSRTKYSNFRRPGLKVTRKPDPEPETEPPTTPKPTRAGRYNPRLTANARSTTAKTTAQKASPRQSFIVRGESRTTTAAPAYRRKSAGRSPSRTTTLSTRPKAPRINTGRSNLRASTSRNTGRTRTTTNRATSRQRNSYESHSGERFNNHNNILNDGKITVTHQIPTEVTFPVYNGKFTEYKNVLSATPRIEILNLNQVSTSIGPLGNSQLVLIEDSTELAENGATKIIKYVLHETPTTTAIFTPTTIRGRKTSFAHIIPSTVYNVEAVTQTQAAEINANVPLANLLLSQLLLGNQQPAINPLLALQGQGLIPQQQVVQTPVTEFKVRTTTYVTTVVDNRETVLAITFKGRPIQTTITDPTTNVITATEFITDTVITTPTAFQAAPVNPQFNTALLQQLLQQQQQQQQALLQTANPLLGLGLAQPDLNQNLNHVQNNLNNDIYSNSPKPNILSDFASNEDFSEDQNVEEDAPPAQTPRPRTRARAPRPSPAAPAKLTSIVTLYVSGKHPGEFSTVLSTVVSDDTQVVRKREAIYYEDVKVSPSILPTVDELFGSQIDSTRVIADAEKAVDNSYVENQVETESLESIVGEVSKHIKYDASPTYVMETANPSAIRYIIQNSDDVS